MAYTILLSSCTVDGLPLNEFRVLAEKSTSSPETRDEKNRKVEFATPTFNVLNALEQMGYKVVTSGAFVTGHNKFDQARRTDRREGPAGAETNEGALPS